MAAQIFQNPQQTQKPDTKQLLESLQKEADRISDRVTRTPPRLPKEVRELQFETIKMQIAFRNQKYLGIYLRPKESGGFTPWKMNRSETDILTEFNRINDWRQRVWYKDIHASTLESNPDFMVSQSVYMEDLTHKPHLMAFQFNNTDPRYNSSTVILKGYKFLTPEAPLTEQSAKVFRNLLHNHEVTTLVRLTAECEFDKKQNNKKVLKCFDYWSGHCSIDPRTIQDPRSLELTIPLDSERSSDPAYKVNYVTTDEWEDNSAGNVQRLLDLVLKTRAVHDPSTLMAMHCHSSVARTGTTIVCCVVMNLIDQQILSGTKPENVNISIEEIVCEASLQRFHMVGRGPQHVSAYRVIDLYIQGLMTGKYKPKFIQDQTQAQVPQKTLESKQKEQGATGHVETEGRTNAATLGYVLDKFVLLSAELELIKNFLISKCQFPGDSQNVSATAALTFSPQATGTPPFIPPSQRSASAPGSP